MAAQLAAAKKEVDTARSSANKAQQELSAERHSRMEAEKLVAELRQRLDNLKGSRAPVAGAGASGSGKRPATTSGSVASTRSGNGASGSGPTVAAAALAPEMGAGEVAEQQKEALDPVPASPAAAATSGRKSGASPRKSGKRAAAGPNKGFGAGK
jgi:hypothetical protein